MSHKDQMTAYIAAPPTGHVFEVVATSNLNTRRNVEAATSAGNEALVAVGDYLRDLGLRDPDAIAAESHRIVAEAQRESASPTLTEAALRLTVLRLEHFLAVLASQSGSPGEVQRLTSSVAARLPLLLGEFPQAFSARKVSDKAAASLRNEVTPVVPAARPQPMHRQRLSLVPASLQKLAAFVRGS